MRHILSRANHKVFERIAPDKLLLAFDYDGTLAPIVALRERARMRPATRRLLVRLARRYHCAVISGRARADLSLCLAGVRGIELIGNHGIESRRVSVSSLRAVERWLPRLEQRLAGCRGVVIENKAFSLTIHYREAAAKRRTLAAVRAAVAALGDARIVPGIESVNVLPRAAADKGIALEEARQHAGCAAALYVGDDETDETVFARRRTPRLVTVRVGRSRTSAAEYFIRDQSEIDALLERLLSLPRAASRTRAA